MKHIVIALYFIAVFLFIIGLKLMSSPKTARKGNLLAGLGMLLAIVSTFMYIFQLPKDNLFHMKLALALAMIILGAVVGWFASMKVPMTAMPQMVALFNGMGGGAASIIGYIDILHGTNNLALNTLAGLAIVIGSVSFSGSIGAFLKLQRWINDRPILLPMHQLINLVLFISVIVLLVLSLKQHTFANALIVASLVFGFIFVLPIGGADMPVVISLFNALTGLAVAFDGFALENYTLIISGTIVGASGTLLTILMARAMNRSLANILFGAVGRIVSTKEDEHKVMKQMSIDDAGVMLAYADNVIIVPGFGLAAAQAQHKLKELYDLLESRGVNVKFAIHPVAGRMPGHMNVLLAEAGVPYEKLYDLEEINEEFKNADVVLVVGANDVVNPSALNDPSSPIYGMPILKAHEGKNVLVIKRGKGRGFAGIDNELFYMDKTYMLFGDAKDVLNKLIQTIKKL